MARIREASYDPTTPEAITALAAFFNVALANLKDPTAAVPDTAMLTEGLPQGSLTSAEVVEDQAGLAIAVTIKDRTPRLLAPEGFLLLRSLVLFDGGAAIIDKNQTGADRKDYVEVFHINFQRIMADAQAGEQVTLGTNHYDLRAPCLTIAGGKPTTGRGRREAIKAALAAYDKNAESWGLATTLTRDEYRMLLRGAFKLFDANHGHHFLRPIGAA